MPQAAARRFTVTVIGAGMAAAALGLGMSLIWGGPARTSAPSFDPIRSLAPMQLWGWVFAVCGAAALISHVRGWLRVTTTAHGLCGFAALFWCGAFIVGLTNPLASLTGVFGYFAIGLTHTAVAADALQQLRWRD